MPRLICPVWSESSLGAHVILLVCYVAAQLLVFVFLSRLVSWAGCEIRLKRFLIIALSSTFLRVLWFLPPCLTEPRHDKTNKFSVCPAKTQISLGIRPVWSESSLSAWRKLRSLTTHWAHSEDSDQTGRMPRLIWVFTGRTVTLLALSCRGSTMFFDL